MEADTEQISDTCISFLISRRNSRDVYWGAYTIIRLSMHILYIVPNVAQGLRTNLGYRRYELA